MKTVLKFWYIIILSLCILLPFHAQSQHNTDSKEPADKKTIHITTGEWPPYLSQHLPYYGSLNRIITEAFAAEGINIIYGFFPWKRALLQAQSGEWDGTSLWGYHNERLPYFYHSDMVAEQTYHFFHLREFNFDWSSYKDLKGLKIGATYGFNYHTEFETAEKEGLINVQRVTIDEQNIRKLLAGRIHLALLEKVVATNLINTLLAPEEKNRITFHPKVQSRDGLYLLLSKKNAENKSRIESFNRGLKKLKHSGRADTLIQAAMSTKYPDRSEKKSPDNSEDNNHYPATRPVNLAYVDFPPYEYNDHGKPSGVLVKIVKTAFQKAGIPLTLTYLPFARAYEEVKSGNVDGLFNFYKTDERLEYFDYSVPVIKNPLVFFVSKNSTIEFNTLRDLTDLKIGVLRGYTYGSDFDKSHFFSKDEAGAHTSNFKKLNVGRIHAYPCDKLVGIHVATGMDIMSDLKILPTPLKIMDGHIGFSKGNHQHTIKKVNAIINQMHQSGEIEMILSHYTQKYGL